MRAFNAGLMAVLLGGIAGGFTPAPDIKGAPRRKSGSAHRSRCRKDTNKAVAKRRRNRKIADRSKRINWRLRK